MYGRGDDDERVNFKVGELQIDVYTVESDNEIEEDVLRFCGNFGEKFFLDCGEGGETI